MERKDAAKGGFPGVNQRVRHVIESSVGSIPGSSSGSSNGSPPRNRYLTGSLRLMRPSSFASASGDTLVPNYVTMLSTGRPVALGNPPSLNSMATDLRRAKNDEERPWRSEKQPGEGGDPRSDQIERSNATAPSSSRQTLIPWWTPIRRRHLSNARMIAQLSSAPYPSRSRPERSSQ